LPTLEQPKTDLTPIITDYHVSTGTELLTFKNQPHEVNAVAFAPDGHTLAAALHDGSVRLWHAPESE
jgi:WD40 repeat protein